MGNATGKSELINGRIEHTSDKASIKEGLTRAQYRDRIKADEVKEKDTEEACVNKNGASSRKRKV